jgi:regulator of cell morphogenesis and NO signaling
MTLTATSDTRIRDIVAADYRTAAVFQRHHIDFCCHGSRTIDQGCRTAGVEPEVVLAELAALPASVPEDTPRFDSWSARALADYIVDTHHGYVRQAIPLLLQHTTKVAKVHGARHPELVHIADLFCRVAAEMDSHMMKEERVLFPFIAALEDAAGAGSAPPAAPFGTVANPIHMMESEHEFVGDAMAEMRHLTNGFTPPAEACTTWRVCLQELDAFEKDLHAHVHLENNILFPRACALECAR